jgi:hypothetical protein
MKKLEGTDRLDLEEAKKVIRQMAKVLMDLGAGDDEHDKANRLVKRYCPDIYKEYE